MNVRRVTLSAVAAGSVFVFACSGSSRKAGAKPFKLVIVDSPPLGTVEDAGTHFQIAAEDSAGTPVSYHGTVAISGIGPVTPVAVGMSSQQLDVDVVFELGGDNEVTFSSPGLQPASLAIYVGPALPTPVAGPMTAGSILDASSGWDQAGAWSPSVVYVGTSYRLYYASSGGGMGAGIGLAVSLDGVDFARFGSSPLVGPGSVASPCHSAGASAPDVFQTGATWTMIYQGRSSGPPHLCRATSVDGLAWSPQGQVLAVSTSADAFDNVALDRFAAVTLTNGSFEALYGARGNTAAIGPVYAIGYATSPDGVVWTKTPADELDGAVEYGGINLPDENEWEDHGVTGPAVERLGGVFRVWASGLGSIGGVWRIGRYANMSLPGLNSHLEGATDYTEVVPLGPPMSFDDTGDMDPSVVMGPDGIVRLYFTGLRADGTRRIGLSQY